MAAEFDYDYIVVGSGFGGSVSCLRLAEKGYRVLVLEKGKWFGADDFPETNWELRKWLWLPFAKFFGIFKMTFFKGVVIYSGTGVGGGSLTYANTLPMPKKPFFESPSWAHLGDWEQEMKPFYKIASRMLGIAKNPKHYTGDLILQEIARDLGKEDAFEATEVSVFFGEPEKTVPDPYFNGEGPEREGCRFCGGCMLGCRYNAKNTLDKNYLYLAQKHGAKIQAESEVYDIVPLGALDGADGYEVRWKQSTRLFRPAKGSLRCRGVVLAGGVLGTVKLLLDLKEGSLPHVSDKVGCSIRTNSESLLSVTTIDREKDLSQGIAIGSILHVDKDTHYEIVRYSRGSGFFRTQSMPAIYGKNFLLRMGLLILDFLRTPLLSLKAMLVPDWSKYNQILLLMQTLDATLRFKKGRFGLKSTMSEGEKPTPFIPLAFDLARRFATKVKGKPIQGFQETLFGMPSTAHILGGACMGRDSREGVISRDNELFGYKNIYVCDGAAVSANIGVNPALTITAISERAMDKVPAAGEK